MTAYKRAATALRTLAVLAVAATGFLAGTSSPWWAALTGWIAFLAVLLGGLCHLAHRRTIADHTARTRHALTDKETTTT